MKNQTEKRICKRHCQETRVVCTRFNSCTYCKATMINYSEGGLYLESEIPFKSGSSIHIKLEAFLSITNGSPPHNGFRTSTLGEVKWCKDLSTKESDKYGMGVKYYEPY